MKNLKLLSKILMAGGLMMLTTHLFAQTGGTDGGPASANQALTMGIPAIALINAVDTTGTVKAVSLQLTTTVAGDKITGGTGTSFAQVSSITNGVASFRTISVACGNVPAGTTLDVTGILPNSNAGGTLGATNGTVTGLSSAAQVVFTGVGSCYTGTASGDGYKFHWKWNAGAAGAYGSIVGTAGASATVVITISALGS